MSSYDLSKNSGAGKDPAAEPVVIVAELVPEPPARELSVARIVRRRIWLPVGLFVATCFTTLLAPAMDEALLILSLRLQAHGLADGLVHGGALALAYCWKYVLSDGWKYALPVMTILVCHEAGHFLQTLRYRVYSSLPYFIPMPIGPLGTLGAVIGMDARRGDRRALFDIGITGPLAGLVPTLVFCIVGLQWSRLDTLPEDGSALLLGEPLLFKLLAHLTFGPLPAGQDIVLHPTAFAGWVGLLLTALNLMPIGQLDGGHILYALLRTRAHRVASLLLLAAAVAIVSYQLLGWTLMLVLLLLMGRHPPTADDNVRLGSGRIVLGWLALAFIPIGFTPRPFIFGP